MSDDRNLLFGVMAVQLKLITPQNLMEAAAAWSVNREGALKDYLIERGQLSAKSAQMLEGLMSEQVNAHGGDVRLTLASFGGDRAVKESFAASSLMVAGDSKLESFGGAPLRPITTEKEPLTISKDGPAAEKVLEDSSRLTLEHPGRYSVQTEHGRGGIGRVLVAFDAHIGREIAIKELLPESSAATPSFGSGRRSQADTSRFLREARITGQLEHPAIVPVYELGRRPDGSVYYTMKFVRGKTLFQAIKEAKGIDGRLKLLTHFLDLCHALAYAHSRNVIHRDIKPQNVMVGEFGETVVIDWGLAKVKGKKDERGESMEHELKMIREGKAMETLGGAPLGTPAYMSPEQAEGKLEEVDERSDIWSLGAVLYEILAGDIPFPGVNVYDIMGKVLKDDPVPIGEKEPLAPVELQAIVMKCLVKDPDNRYQRAMELADDVENYMTGRLVTAYQYPLSVLIKRWLAKWWPVVSTAAAAVLVLLAVFIWSYLQIREQRNQALLNIAEAYSAYGLWAEAEKRWGAAELYYSQSLNMVDRPQMRYALNYACTAPALAARLKFTLAGSPAAVNEIVVNPDGNILAAGGEDNLIRLWDLASGELRRTLSGHKAPALALAFSRDGKLLASGGGDGMIAWWDPFSGRMIQSLQGPGQAIKWLAFSPDGKMLAAAGEDPVAMIFDAASGQLRQKLVGHAGNLRGLAFSPDGLTLATWGKDKTVKLWDPATGQLKFTLAGHQKAVMDAAFTADGGRLVSAGWDNAVRLWDVQAGNSLGVYKGPSPARFVRVSPDGARALVGDDGGEAELVDLASMTRLRAWNAHPGSLFHLVAFPDFRWFATAGGDRMVCLWSVDQEAPVNKLQAQSELAYRLAISPNGSVLAVAGAEKTVRVWALDHSSGVKKIPVLDGKVWEMKADAEGKFVALSNQTGQVKILDLAQDQIKDVPLGCQDGVRALAISPNSQWLVAGSWDKTVKAWNLKDWKPQPLETTPEHSPTDKVWAVVITPDSTLAAAAGDDKVVRVWRLSAGQFFQEFKGHGDKVRALAVSPDGKTLASGSLDKTVRLWSLDQSAEPKVLAGHTDGLSVLAFSPDGKLLASGGINKDHTVRIWDVAAGKLLRTLEGHEDWIRYLSFSQDGRFIISGGEDGSARIWEAATGKLEKTMTGTTDTLRCMNIRPDFGLLAVGSGDRLVRLWNPFTGELMHVLAGHPGSVEQVAFIWGRTDSMLVSADDTGAVLVWPFKDEFFQTAPAALQSKVRQDTGLEVQGMEAVPVPPPAGPETKAAAY